MQDIPEDVRTLYERVPVLTIPLIIPAMIIDYIVLLGSAMYGVNGLCLCRKFDNFSSVAIIVNIVLQFFFCANVISAIYCYVKVRKASKSLNEA